MKHNSAEDDGSSCCEHFERDLVDGSFDPMLVIDQEGIILMANEAATTVFGYTHDEFVGRNITMICGEGHAERHDEYMRRYLETGEKRIIGKVRKGIKAKRKDGSEFPVQLGVREVIMSSNFTPPSSPGSRCSFSSNSNSSDRPQRRVFCGYIKGT